MLLIDSGDNLLYSKHTVVIPQKYSVRNKSTAFKIILVVKVQKYLYQNILQVAKVKVLIMQNVSFQNNAYYIIGL